MIPFSQFGEALSHLQNMLKESVIIQSNVIYIFQILVRNSVYIIKGYFELGYVNFEPVCQYIICIESQFEMKFCTGPQDLRMQDR